MDPVEPQAPGRGKLPLFELVPAVPAKTWAHPSSSEDEVQVISVLLSRLKDYLAVRRKRRADSYYVTTLRVAKAGRALAGAIGRAYSGKAVDMPDYQPLLTAAEAINLFGVSRTQEIINSAELILARVKGRVASETAAEVAAWSVKALSGGGGAAFKFISN